MTDTEFAITFCELPTDRQNAFLAKLKEVLTEDEYKTTATYLSAFGLFYDPEKYEAMKNAVTEVMCKAFYGGKNS